MTSTTAPTTIHPGLDVPTLTALLHPDRELWSPSDLRELTSRTAGELATALLDLVSYVPNQRWWTRLALTHAVELWLLSWLPGQRTEPHDHGGAVGSFTVLTGTLTESYRYPGHPIRRAHRPTGVTVAFGAGRAHQVGNQHSPPAASVHAYSPPLVPTRQYSSLLDLPNDPPAPPAHPGPQPACPHQEDQ